MGINLDALITAAPKLRVVSHETKYGATLYFRELSKADRDMMWVRLAPKMSIIGQQTGDFLSDELDTAVLVEADYWLLSKSLCDENGVLACNGDEDLAKLKQLGPSVIEDWLEGYAKANPDTTAGQAEKN